MKGENDITAFLPMNTKIGGPIRYAKHKKNICLTTDQARHINKKVESEGIVNVDTMKQEMEGEKLTREKDNDINLYQKIVVNNIDKKNVKTSHMVYSSIFSNVVNYVQYDRDSMLCMAVLGVSKS